MDNSSSEISYFPLTCGLKNLLQCRIAVWLWKICPITLLMLGTIGNCLSVIVLTRKRMRKYSNTVFLLFFAVSDCLFLWTIVLRYSLLSYNNIKIKDLSLFNCILHDWITFTSAGISAWVLVLMTIERMAYTKWPIFTRTKLKPNVAFVTCIVIVICVAVFCSPLLFLFKRDNEIDELPKCVFVSMLAYQIKINKWRFMAYPLLNVIPIILVVVGNIGLIITLQLRKRRIQPLSSSQQGVLVTKTAYTTKMLFLLSVFFVMTTTPYCIAKVIMIEAVKILTPERIANIQLLNAITIILFICNYTFNFYLYFISGTLFKQEWNNIVQAATRRLTHIYRACRQTQRNTAHTANNITIETTAL